MSLARIVAVLAALGAGAAHAQGKPKPPSCPAQPVQCQVRAPAFFFGRIDQTYLPAPMYVQGSVAVSCTKQRGLSVDVELELRGLPGEVTRELRQDTETLTYAFFLKSNHTIPWGDGSAGTQPITDSLKLRDNDTAVTKTYTLYGRLDGNQGGSPGRYFGAVVPRLFYTPACK